MPGKSCRGTQIVFLSLFCFSLFYPEVPCFARDFGNFVVWLKNVDCGKFEHSFASYYYCLVVEMVVKRGVFTTKGLGIS